MKLFKCSLCNKKKQPTEFYLRKNGTVGEYKCKDCIKNKRTEYYHNNYEKVRECNRVAVSKYQKNNRDKETAKTAKYNAKKKQRLPSWVDKTELSKIKSLYKKARSISKQTGIRHEVDHIIPLNGKEVSGLHTIHNLQIIPKEDNLKKSNKFFEDIVCTSERSEESK